MYDWYSCHNKHVAVENQSSLAGVFFHKAYSVIYITMSYIFSDRYGYLQNSSGGLVSAVSLKYKKKYNKIKRIIKDLVFVSTGNVFFLSIIASMKS